MNRFFMSRYRVVADFYLGYEAQVRWWWCPVWFQLHKPGLITNTHSSEKEAWDFIKSKIDPLTAKKRWGKYRDEIM